RGPRRNPVRSERGRPQSRAATARSSWVDLTRGAAPGSRVACDDGAVRRSRQQRSSRPVRSSGPPAAPRNQARRAGVAALIALSLGLVTIVLGQGFSTVGAIRALE